MAYDPNSEIFQRSPQGPYGTLQSGAYASPTPSLDLPAALQGLFGPSSPQVSLGATGDAMPSSPGELTFINTQYGQQPMGFADGGVVPPEAAMGQVPVAGAPPMAGVTPPAGPAMPQVGGPAGVGVQGQGGQQISEQDIQQFIQQNPQAVQQISAELQQLISSGEMTVEELNTAEQLATVALQNPEMYPQLRQYAVQSGIADENEIPQQYDPGMLTSIIIASRAIKSQGAGPAMEAEPPAMNMADGGLVTPHSNAKDGGFAVGPGTGRSDSIPIRVSAGEYVIPAHVVHMKGKEFFDTLLEKYKDETGG